MTVMTDDETKAKELRLGAAAPVGGIAGVMLPLLPYEMPGWRAPVALARQLGPGQLSMEVLGYGGEATGVWPAGTGVLPAGLGLVL